MQSCERGNRDLHTSENTQWKKLLLKVRGGRGWEGRACHMCKPSRPGDDVTSPVGWERYLEEMVLASSFFHPFCLVTKRPSVQPRLQKALLKEGNRNNTSRTEVWGIINESGKLEEDHSQLLQLKSTTFTGQSQRHLEMHYLIRFYLQVILS